MKLSEWSFSNDNASFEKNSGNNRISGDQMDYEQRLEKAKKQTRVSKKTHKLK
ncbi:hypothetical protein [Geomicrobium sp. JCM 19055]|uniref:hypothetical protein n=1 Tax=Geomicrobium sp. JCM 19055 TaxID=1460649 RepID=UPI00045ED3CC|nr:hypothetical protein [Geomicrobium sp. JCM 19055]GAK01472.1 hypothetical protein JCM19055_4638 [Geomicrobium sp. JCM 19055]